MEVSASSESDTHPGDTTDSSPGFLAGLVVILFGLILALLCIEAGLRILEHIKTPAHVRSDRPNAYYNPGAAKTLQGNVISGAKEPGTFRITVVGDSFSFAPYMQFDDAFPARLERMLELSGSTRPVEVLNYGVPGFSTSHEVDEVRRALKEGSDLILLQITLNDPQRKPYRPTGLTGTHQFGEYTPGNSWIASSRLYRLVAERVHNTNTHRRYREYYFDLFSNSKNWDSFSESLRKIARSCERHSTQCAAVIFPLFGVAVDDSYPFHPLHEKIQKRLAELSVPALDLFESYRGIPLERIQVIPGGDFHPNEIGHRIAAEALYAWLSTEKLIPQDILVKNWFSQRTDIRIEKNRLE